MPFILLVHAQIFNRRSIVASSVSPVQCHMTPSLRQAIRYEGAPWENLARSLTMAAAVVGASPGDPASRHGGASGEHPDPREKAIVEASCLVEQPWF